jgi:SAM-dependent methyltransferase
MSTEFNDLEFNLAYPDGVETTYWSWARNSILYQTIKKRNLYKGSILEIGCGRGLIIKYLSDRNIDCFGVELAKTTPVKGVEKKIITGQDAFSFNEEFAKKFNTIMLLDVLEHIEDDYGFLKSIADKYSNTSHLLITVPAKKEIWTNFDDFYGHFRRYDINELVALVNKAGFDIIDVRYVFKSVYLIIKLLKKFKVDRTLESPVPKNGIMKLLHRIIAICFIVEYWIMPKRIYGSSILCVATRKINN